MAKPCPSCGGNRAAKTEFTGEYVATMPDGSKVTVASKTEERAKREAIYASMRAKAARNGYTVEK